MTTTKSTYQNVSDLTSMYIKSYASRENLMKAVDAMGLINARIQIVKTTDDRWTAIFQGADQMDNWHRSNTSFYITG